MNQYEEYMLDYFCDYERTIQKYVDAIFMRHIFPYLQKYKLDYVAGNGDFWIGYTDETPKWFVRKYHGYYGNSIDQDKLSNDLQGILHPEIPGIRDNDLGSFVSIEVVKGEIK